MSKSDLTAIFYLQRQLVIGWFRRSMRSPFFWIFAVVIAVVLFAQIGGALAGSSTDSGMSWLDDTALSALAAIAILASILIGLWRGTSATPVASLADVVVLMGSPISARLQFTLLMARPIVTNAFVFGIWTVIALGGVAADTGDPWISLRVFTAVFILVLLSEIVRFAVWTSTEQVVVRSLQNGMRSRTGIKALCLALIAAVAVRLLQPVVAGDVSGWRDALDVVTTRAEELTAYPPISMAADIVTPGGSTLMSVAGLFLICVVIGALTLLLATDFVEPVGMTAERKTDPRGHMTEAGSDIQWATLSQVGVSPRFGLSIPPFGKGAWAILWAGLVRWVRYQFAALWVTLASLAVLAVIVGGAVRLDFIEPEVAWFAALFMPFFGSVNMFVDEMRKPFLFLTPGSAVIRLIAAAIPSVLDGISATVLVAAILAAIGAVPIAQAIGLVVLGTAISLLAQASVALVQLVVPYWVGYRIRVTLTTLVTLVTFQPALVALVVFYIAIGPVFALLLSSFAAAAAGLVIFAIGAFQFDRIEFSG